MWGFNVSIRTSQLSLLGGRPANGCHLLSSDQLRNDTIRSSWRSLRSAAKQSWNQTMRCFRKTANSDFTTASPERRPEPNAGFASCYK